ncbi:thiamine biosynthesis lipoprotein [Rhodobacteraceae bacterium MBR-64]
MPQPNRRRFLTISAAALGAAALPRPAIAMRQWRGVAMGAGASITLAHPDADRIIARARAEIARLEAVFSLYDARSALSRLNARGRLEAPPFEMLDCLGLCDAVNAATLGLFDPTVQPLWALYAEAHARGTAPDAGAIAAVLPRVGWPGVRVDSAAITLRPGMALTLNGVAQGYVADRVATLLAAEGLTDILVNTGEFRALGGAPEGGDWPVALVAGGKERASVALRDRALATSAPMGTVFDAEGRVGHILHPGTGRPAPARWQMVSVTAPQAALADALTTAFCLMDRPAIDAALARFPAARLVFAG